MTSDIPDPRRPVDDEPAYEAAATLSIDELRRRIEGVRTSDGCVVVAVNGRSAAGKSTLADRLAAGAAGWSVVHTDDIAWHHSFFDWGDLLVDGVLDPLRRDGAVSYRPPPWDERERSGAITAEPGTRVLVVEGVGSSQAALADHLDVALWVHVPFDAVLAREEARFAAGIADRGLSDEWLPAEAGFHAADRPWSRADLVVAGDPETAAGPDQVVVLTDPAIVAEHLAAEGGSTDTAQRRTSYESRDGS